MRPPTLTDRARIYHMPKEEFVDHYLEALGLKNPWYMSWRSTPDDFKHHLEYAYLGRVRHVNESPHSPKYSKTIDGVIVYLDGLDEGFFWDEGYFHEQEDNSYSDKRRKMPSEGEILLLLPHEKRETRYEICDSVTSYFRTQLCHRATLLRQHKLEGRIGHFDRPIKHHILGLLGGRG
ncbi:MAG: hypothetical protein KJ709_04495 [Nanoarchaeota archaeon]|nr:hypothetical protein [Nanoarchaeota archaeon]